MADLARANGWGLLHRVAPGVGWEIALGFIACDLCGYAIHRMSHRLAWPWRLHRVHHSDSDLDLSTYFRSHPLEVLLVIAVKFVAIVALGLHPAALLLHGLAKHLTMALGHAGIGPDHPLSRIASPIFVTPGFHRVHHSARPLRNRQQLRRGPDRVGPAVRQRRAKRRHHRTVRAGGCLRCGFGQPDRPAQAAVRVALKHRAEKWAPVFRKRRCENKGQRGWAS